MHSLKSAIFAEIKKINLEFSLLSEEEINKIIFHHPDGMRLSLNGFRIVKTIFTAYSFQIPLTIKSRHHFGMSKIEYPYFLTSRRLVLFSEMDATVVKLSGGIEQFLETCSQL